MNGAETITLNAAAAAAGLTFQNTGTTLIDSSNTTTQTLSIGTGGITINANTGAVTLGNATNAANLTLTGAQSWTNNSSNALTVVNGLSLGANPLSFAGTGSFALNGVVTGRWRVAPPR